MKIEKKYIKESLNITNKDKKTFSEKKQNIILTEKQLENLLYIIQKQ
jgi:hypothetical protein